MMRTIGLSFLLMRPRAYYHMLARSMYDLSSFKPQRDMGSKRLMSSKSAVPTKFAIRPRADMK